MKFARKVPSSLVERYRKQTPPWGPLGYVTYKRTYSRMREDLGRQEEWTDTIERVTNGLLNYGMRLSVDEVDDFFGFLWSMKTGPAGRGYWQIGTKTVERLGGASLQNCWFVSVRDLNDFCFLMDMLMLGGGVGFSVLPSDAHVLPHVKRNVKVSRVDSWDVDFVVSDNREGWTELLRRVLQTYCIKGGSFTYSTRAIRPAGTPISSFGGTASGSEILVDGINKICSILDQRGGRHWRSTDVLDVCNIIGSIVVAGNVRRSAQIAIGHAQDMEYLMAKRWDTGTIPNWRAMSNNTVACNDTSRLPGMFWDGYQANGEPYGLFNKGLCQSHGRLADGKYEVEDNCEGVNPCAESTLASYEPCCLAENYLPMIKDREELLQAVRYSYLIAKTQISMPFHWSNTQEVVAQNRRLGISVTGVMATHLGMEDLDMAYKMLREVDDQYSQEIRVSKSIKLTSVKPSGTVSLMPGVPPGMHPEFAPYYIRRMRMASEDKLVKICRDYGYPVEPLLGYDNKPDHKTMVISFPVKGKKSAIMANQLKAVEQIGWQVKLQTYWADNAVSVTNYYRDGELPEVQNWLKENYSSNIKTISFCLHTGHGFAQAPYEEVTKSRYEELVAKCKPITGDIGSEDLSDLTECLNGACPVK